MGGLSEIVPDARLEVVAGGRHDVSLTEVEALAAAVKACASRRDPREACPRTLPLCVLRRSGGTVARL